MLNGKNYFNQNCDHAPLFHFYTDIEKCVQTAKDEKYFINQGNHNLNIS